MSTPTNQSTPLSLEPSTCTAHAGLYDLSDTVSAISKQKESQHTVNKPFVQPRNRAPSVSLAEVALMKCMLRSLEEKRKNKRKIKQYLTFDDEDEDSLSEDSADYTSTTSEHSSASDSSITDEAFESDNSEDTSTDIHNPIKLQNTRNTLELWEKEAIIGTKSKIRKISKDSSKYSHSSRSISRENTQEILSTEVLCEDLLNQADVSYTPGNKVKTRGTLELWETKSKQRKRIIKKIDRSRRHLNSRDSVDSDISEFIEKITCRNQAVKRSLENKCEENEMVSTIYQQNDEFNTKSVSENGMHKSFTFSNRLEDELSPTEVWLDAHVDHFNKDMDADIYTNETGRSNISVDINTNEASKSVHSESNVFPLQFNVNDATFVASVLKENTSNKNSDDETFTSTPVKMIPSSPTAKLSFTIQSTTPSRTYLSPVPSLKRTFSNSSQHSNTSTESKRL